MANIEVYISSDDFKNFHFFPFKSRHTASRHLFSISTRRWIVWLNGQMCMRMLVIYAKFIDYTVDVCDIFFNHCTMNS